MSALIDGDKIQAMEYVRRMGGTTEAAIEFAQFSVGLPGSTSMDQIWVSYVAAKYGPEAISMDTMEEVDE